MANCVTCGDALHPERAEKYRYCTKPACQERNAKGVTIVAVAVNVAPLAGAVSDTVGDWFPVGAVAVTLSTTAVVATVALTLETATPT